MNDAGEDGHQPKEKKIDSLPYPRSIVQERSLSTTKGDRSSTMKFAAAVLSYVLWTARSSAAFGVQARRSAVDVSRNSASRHLSVLMTRRLKQGVPAVCPWTSATSAAILRGGEISSSTSTTPTRLQSTATVTEEATKPVEIFRTDYKPLPFTVDQVEMDFDIRDGKTLVKTALVWKKNPAPDADDKIILDGDETSVTLKSVLLNGKELTDGVDYVLRPGQMELFVDLKDRDKLETVVEIVPEDNTQLSGLYKSGSMYCTQCEALGFRRIT